MTPLTVWLALLGGLSGIAENCDGYEIKFFQNGYRLVHHHAEVLWFNKSVLANMTLINQHFNRTRRTFSGGFTLKRDLDQRQLWVNIVTFVFLSNEYKRFAPISPTYNFCDAMRWDSFGIKVLTTTNGNLTLCPIKKGTYWINHFTLEDSKLPPFVPEGTYRVHFNFFERTAKLHALAWYGMIEKLNKT